MTITTPFLYLLYFVAGLAASFRCIALFLRAPADHDAPRCLLSLLWFFVPVVMVIALDSVFYDSWRHLFFVYPAFLLIALQGLTFVLDLSKRRLGPPLRTVAKVALTCAVVLSLATTIRFMVRHHPHQNVYFNRLAGPDMATVKIRFEMDYWGLSYRRALEYIVENDQRPRILVHAANRPGEIQREATGVDRRDRGCAT